MKAHKNTHLDVKPFSCTTCNKTFATSSLLSRHMFNHMDKTFSCNLCNKIYTKPGSLRLHRRTAHQNKDAFQCDQCQRTFSDKRSFQGHLLVHSGKKPFVCEEKGCGRSFNNKSNLRIHSYLHLDKKPHACDQCDMSFTRPSHLKSHQKRHA